jgi:hypothetical protein
MNYHFKEIFSTNYDDVAPEGALPFYLGSFEWSFDDLIIQKSLEIYSPSPGGWLSNKVISFGNGESGKQVSRIPSNMLAVFGSGSVTIRTYDDMAWAIRFDPATRFTSNHLASIVFNLIASIRAVSSSDADVRAQAILRFPQLEF